MKIPNDVKRKIKAGECNEHWVVHKDGEVFALRVELDPESDERILVRTGFAVQKIVWKNVKKIVG